MRAKLWPPIGPRRLLFFTVDSQAASPPAVDLRSPGSSGCRLEFRELSRGCRFPLAAPPKPPSAHRLRLTAPPPSPSPRPRPGTPASLPCYPQTSTFFSARTILHLPRGQRLPSLAALLANLICLARILQDGPSERVCRARVRRTMCCYYTFIEKTYCLAAQAFF